MTVNYKTNEKDRLMEIKESLETETQAEKDWIKHYYKVKEKRLPNYIKEAVMECKERIRAYKKELILINKRLEEIKQEMR